MLDKYIAIKESSIIAKQTSGGIWYCSELPAKTTQELDLLISEVNKILNKYNEPDKPKKTKPKAENKIRGLES
jgi:hypothetical protein